MRLQLAGRLFVTWALVVAPLVTCARAQDVKPGPSPASGATATSATDNQGKAPEPSRAPTVTYSTGIADILKMADAKVSPEVIRQYIETASIPYNPTPADIIALKEHAVADDITAALVRRGAEVRGQMVPSGADPAAPRYVENNAGYGGLDPESYDFFRYYYLYPRTLASVYQRLAPYHPELYYGYYQPWFSRPGYYPGGYFNPRRGGFSNGYRGRDWQRSPGYRNQSFDRSR